VNSGLATGGEDFVDKIVKVKPKEIISTQQ
jgi:hypothetical protein